MAWVGTRGGEIVKADLDLLATEAERVLDRAGSEDGGEMGRTFDVINGDADPSYVPATMTGAFTFSTETETYPHDSGGQLGDLVQKTPARWAWCDELNRIWKCMWNIPNNYSFRAGDQYPFGYGDWDLWDSGGPANGKAWEFIEGAFPAMDGWFTQFPSTLVDNALTTMVCSPGPIMFTRIQDDRPDFATGDYARAYANVNFLYSKDQLPFDIYYGLFTPQVTIDGDQSVHSSVLPPPNYMVEDTFNYDNLPAGCGMFGYYEVEYRWVGTGTPYDPRIGTTDLHWYVASGPYITGYHGDEWDGAERFYMWINDGSTDRTADTVMMDAAATHFTAGVGPHTAVIRHHVDSTDWVWTKTIFRGGLYTSVHAAPDTGVVSDEHVIHPRNASVRAAMHISNDPGLVDADLLDFGALDALLSVPGAGTRTVDTTLRAMFLADTKTYLDDYPVPDADPTLPRAYLLSDLNRLIDGEMDNILYGYWVASVVATITLRPSTRWMIERDFQDEEHLRRMRRLMLEDCYLTELNRIPADEVAPEDEIYKYFLGGDAHDGTADFNVTNLLYRGSYYLSRKDLEVLFIGNGLPQWCSNTYLDYQMPDGSVQGFDYDTSGSRLYGPRGYAYSWTSDSRARFSPALSPVPSNYPVMHKDWFGMPVEGTSAAERPNWSTRGYAPYWKHDEHHIWAVQTQPPAVPAGEVSYSTYELPIESGCIAAGWVYEYTLDNRELEIYVSWNDYPDPNDVSTFQFKSTKGFYSFPADFPSSFGIDDGAHSLWVTVKNPTATSQTFREVISIFKPDGTEAANDPPWPEPRFFPYQEPNNVVRNTGNGWGDSYLFGPWTGTDATIIHKPFPCPQRGQHIRELLIRRLPVRNSAGIYVPPDTEDMEEKEVFVGLMAGAGVISGAIYGSYPGDWVDFNSYTIPAGENELRVSVSYFVLQGAPLAYYVKDTLGSEDDEEFEIFASVEYQPAVNNTFISWGEETINGVSRLRGGFHGPPWVNNTMLYAENLNGDYSGQPPGIRHEQDIVIVQPPVSNRELKAIYDFLLTQ